MLKFNIESPASTIIGLIVEPSSSTIRSFEAEVINQYILSFSVSLTLPMQVAFVKDILSNALPFPKIFCKAPTLEPSEYDTSIFKASLYSPCGKSLSSRSLFILPLMNKFFNSGIF